MQQNQPCIIRQTALSGRTGGGSNVKNFTIFLFSVLFALIALTFVSNFSGCSTT